ncbi:MAG: cytochrome c biogenesis CcdA family protein [Bacteroidales bacterium]
MIQKLFTILTEAVYRIPLIALSASFIWGIFSILLSPCHLASIPLIVGFIGEQGKITVKKAFKLSLVFGIGIFITIGLIGIVTALLGKIAGDIGPWGTYIVAIVFIFVGLYLLELAKFPELRGINHSVIKRKGMLAAFILGLIFGVAVGPCTFAYMAPMLAVTFSISSTKFLYGIFLLLMYAMGHCTVIIVAGTLAEIVETYLQWNERSKSTAVLKKICGIFIILAGLYMFWKA